jgi:acyl-coenzyme A thioesterase PaaI-like protein
MPPDAAVLSIEFKVNMLAPAKGDAIVARGEVIRAGRTVMVCRADVYALNGADEKLVAAMQGTMMVVRREGLSD